MPATPKAVSEIILSGIRKNYLLISLGLLVFGVFLDWKAGSFGLVSEELSLIEDGKIIHRSQIAYPPQAEILRIVAIFLYTASASIFISVFVTNQIENTRAEERAKELDVLNEKINESVFDSLFKTLVPMEIFEVIKQDIIRNKIVRRNAVWQYDFTLGRGEEILFRQTIIAELHNTSHRTFSNSMTLVIDDRDTETTLERVICVIGEKELFSCNATEIEKASGVKIIKDSEHRRRVTLTFDIPQADFATVTIVNRERYPLGSITSFYASSLPLINASLSVTFPPSHEFSIFQSLSTEMVCVLNEADRQRWELKGAILPQQGFQYALKKKVVVAS